MSGRRSERIKNIDQVPFEDKSEDDWSDEHSDTENDEKLNETGKKQIRLLTKNVPMHNTTIHNSNSLQIKIKLPSRTVSPPPQLQQPKKKPKRAEERINLPKDMDPEPVCPICLKIIIGDLDDINEHVDECIGPSTNASSNTNSGITTPFVEQDPATTMQKSLSLVNVDEDDFGYGKSQYSELDVERIIKSDDAKKKVRNDAEEEQETKNSLLIQSILSTSSPSPDFSSLQLALKSLLDRISAAPKCAVCWETLKMPAVASVNCWHVCCEECWLRTLGTKRLCPHCSCITNPSDLRKVFF